MFCPLSCSKTSALQSVWVLLLLFFKDFCKLQALETKGEARSGFNTDLM